MTPEEIIRDIRQLVSLPDAVVRANEILDSPYVNAEEIGEVISHDPALSAQLLRLVNSAFYNFPNKIETISRAITMIGLNELRSMLFASSTTQTFNQLAPETIDMNAFWQRSVFCGLAAKKLAVLEQNGRGEELFLIGLLHDVGRLVLFARLPEQAREILHKAEATGQRLYEVESEVLGFDSAALGSTLLESWRLPKKLWEPVRFQLKPEQAAEFRNEAEYLHLALKITDCVEPELKTGKPLDLDTLDSASINKLELSRELLGNLATDACLESFEVLSIVNPTAAMVY